MAKSKRSMNPADAMRKQQRKRELKKNKEDRKRIRETALAKKDVGKVKQDIARLESLASSGRLDTAGQARLEELRIEAKKIEKAKKATELTGAQAAYAARMQENEKKSELQAKKLVYDPKSGKFVAAKKKDLKAQAESESESSSSEEDNSDSDTDMNDSDEEIAIPEEGVSKDKILTEFDDEYEIPLPPGPPPPRAFNQQFQQAQQIIPPPPPPGPPPFRGPFPVYTPGGRIPPPPPPLMPPHAVYHQQPMMMGMLPPPPPPPLTYHRHVSAARPFTAPVHYNKQPISNTTTTATVSAELTTITKPNVAPTISAEPQLRDLQKELLGFVPAALRRKQAVAKKIASLPKGARPNINAAPSLDNEEEEE